jgi:CheY-like chemotaxis protein
MNEATADHPALLLANHHRDSNTVMAAMLWQDGYDVETVGTLSEAAAKFDRNRFDLFVCRVGMADGCGAEAILKAWRQFRTPGVAIFGSQHSQEIVASISRYVMRGELHIPCGIDHVRDVLSQALGRPIPSLPADLSNLADKSCPDCHGAGRIELLLTRGMCRACGGNGRVTLDVSDLPLRNARLLGPISRRALYRLGARTFREVARLSGADLQHAGLSKSMVDQVESALKRIGLSQRPSNAAFVT